MSLKLKENPHYDIGSWCILLTLFKKEIHGTWVHFARCNFCGWGSRKGQFLRQKYNQSLSPWHKIQCGCSMTSKQEVICLCELKATINWSLICITILQHNNCMQLQIPPETRKFVILGSLALPQWNVLEVNRETSTDHSNMRFVGIISELCHWAYWEELQRGICCSSSES